MIQVESRHILRVAAAFAVVAGVIAVLVPAVHRLGSSIHVTAPAPRAHVTHARPGHPHQPNSLQSATNQAQRTLDTAARVTLGILAIVSCLALLIIARRLYNRRRREYCRYEIHLSMHDQAKPSDLNDMVEALTGALRPRLGQRFLNGQPFMAIELIYGPVDGVMEWKLCLLCESKSAATLEGIITQAYPDVWIGRRFSEPHSGLPLGLGLPGHVLRFHKRRDRVLPGSQPQQRPTDRRDKPSSPIEGIARAQHAAGSPSVVRFQLVPVAQRLERRMRERLDGHSLLFLEVQVAAGDWATANAIAASVMARRGDNQFRRRYVRIRQPLYRRRFAMARPPWLPTPRSIVSSTEAAFLFELPSARMKSVPVRRITRPRIPRSPEWLSGGEPLRLPPVSVTHA